MKRNEYYYLGNNQHVKNKRIFYVKGGDSIVQKLAIVVVQERKRKMVQFKIVFVIFLRGRPMSDYIAQKALFNSLNVLNQPRKHWSLSIGWKIAKSLEMVIINHIRDDLQKASFVSLSCDEVTIVDNQAWLSVTAYRSMFGKRVCHLLQVSRVFDGNGDDSITNMLLTALMHYGGLSPDQVGEKLICGADGASVFQVSCNGVVVHLLRQFSPYIMYVHDITHRMNLTVLSLSGLPMVKKLETLCSSLHALAHLQNGTWSSVNLWKL
jgi:hypothetical protein